MSKKKMVLFGVVAVVVLAGCLGGTGGDGGNTGDGGVDGNESGAGNDAGEVTVAVAVGLGEDAPPGVAERLNLSQSDRLLFQRFRSGQNLTVEEQQRAQQIQREIQQAQQARQEEEEQAVREKREEFEATVNSTRTLSVGGSQRIPQQTSTLFLVSGSPSEILGLLNESGVQAIAGEEQYNRLRQQRQLRQRQPGGGGVPAP